MTFVLLVGGDVDGSSVDMITVMMVIVDLTDESFENYEVERRENSEKVQPLLVFFVV